METCAERLGNGDTLHLVVESLEFVGGIVGHNQGNDVADNSGEETPPDIVAGKINDCADKCEMPVVPKVDIDRTGRFRNNIRRFTPKHTGMMNAPTDVL